MNHEVDPKFAFPGDVADAIDARLRTLDEGKNPFTPKNKPVVRMVDDAGRPTIAPDIPPTTPKQSAEAFSVDLPSRFHYYKFKDLYAVPFGLRHLAKLSKAYETGDLQMQVEVVSSVLSTPSGETGLAFKLTMADYMAVLYFLRMVSFSKPQMRHTSSCTNPDHIAKVKAGTLPQDSLKIETVVLKSDMKTRYLDTIPDPEVYSATVDGVTVPFGPETMGDTIAFLNHPDWNDEEFAFKSRIAAVLKLAEATDRVWSWDQRVQFVDEFLNTDKGILALEFSEMMEDYGVVETVETVCKECGSKGVSRLTCDPLSFLQPKF